MSVNNKTFIENARFRENVYMRYLYTNFHP